MAQGDTSCINDLLKCDQSDKSLFIHNADLLEAVVKIIQIGHSSFKKQKSLAKNEKDVTKYMQLVSVKLKDFFCQEKRMDIFETIVRATWGE
jgi:hypothetical protein